jgi:short-subunit dehydrogenase
MSKKQKPGTTMNNDLSQSKDSMTALITGASSGIGLALAHVMARNGHNLVLAARNEQKLNQLAAELQQEFGITAKVIPIDLSVSNSAQDLFDALQSGIRISLLVNNAGFDVYGNFYETDLAEELRMIQVNLVTLTQLTKLILPGMIMQHYGRILNLGSIGSFAPGPLNAVYSATKAYVLSFSEAIGEELQGSGVTVTALCPGATKTQFHSRASLENIRLLRFSYMEAASVAEIGYRAMMAGKRVVVPGLTNRLQVLFTRLLPRRLVARMAKSMMGSPGQGNTQ